MIKAESYEELMSKYPIDGKTNLYFQVFVGKDHCLTQRDWELVRKTHPNGYKVPEHEWRYFYTTGNMWYDSYVYNGEYWYLGCDSWDGITYTEEPTWGITKYGRTDVAIFKTEEEANEYIYNKVNKERFEF